MARFRFCESDDRAIVALRDEERFSRKGEKFRNANHRGSGRRSSGRKPRKRWLGLRRRSVRPSGRSHFLRRSSEAGAFGRRFRKTGNRQVRLTGARWEPTEVARPRPEPDPPRKDAKPSPARHSDLGQVGAGGNTSSHFALGHIAKAWAARPGFFDSRPAFSARRAGRCDRSRQNRQRSATLQQHCARTANGGSRRSSCESASSCPCLLSP